MIDHLSRLEKLALTTSMAGAVFNVFVWYIGASQPAADWEALYILRIAAGAITAVSFDLVCVVTTMGRRDGRRSAWSWLTALAAAAASALIALDVAARYDWTWLHAANPIIVFLFMQHLAAPRAQTRATRSQTRARLARRLWRLRTEARSTREARAQLAASDVMLAEARGQLASIQAEIGPMRERLARSEPAAANLGRTVEELRDQLRAAREDARRSSHEAASLRDRPAPMPPSRQQVIAHIRGALATGRSLLSIAEELDYSESTLRGWLKMEGNGHAVEG